MAFNLSMLHKNKTISSTVGLFLVLYGGMAKPTLPKFVKELFGNPVFRVAILALIMYRGNKDPQLSLMLSVGFIMIMNQLNEDKIKEKFLPIGYLKMEKDDNVNYTLLKAAGSIMSIVNIMLFFLNAKRYLSGEDDSGDYD